MVRKLRMFSTSIAQGHRITHPGSRSANIAAIAVTMATSKKDAAKAFGMSLYEFTNYGHVVSVGWVHYDGAQAILDGTEPGTVALHPMDHGDLIDGQEDWVLK